MEINISAKHELTRARVNIGSVRDLRSGAAGDQNMKLCLTGGWLGWLESGLPQSHKQGFSFYFELNKEERMISSLRATDLTLALVIPFNGISSWNVCLEAD